MTIIQSRSRRKDKLMRRKQFQWFKNIRNKMDLLLKSTPKSQLMKFTTKSKANSISSAINKSEISLFRYLCINYCFDHANLRKSNFITIRFYFWQNPSIKKVLISQTNKLNHIWSIGLVCVLVDVSIFPQISFLSHCFRNVDLDWLVTVDVHLDGWWRNVVQILQNLCQSFV